MSWLPLSLDNRFITVCIPESPEGDRHFCWCCQENWSLSKVVLSSGVRDRKMRLSSQKAEVNQTTVHATESRPNADNLWCLSMISQLINAEI